MAEFKGTKGNWSYRVGGKNKYGVQEIEIDSDYGIDSLATVYDAEIKDSEDEAIANAKLIAAAPDLLSALQLALSTPHDKWCGEYLKVCENAINKALS